MLFFHFFGVGTFAIFRFAIFRFALNVPTPKKKCGIQPIYAFYFLFVMLTDFVYNKLDVASFLRSSTVYTVPNVVDVLMLTQYSLVLLTIQEKYQNINSTLRNVLKQNASKRNVLIGTRLSVLSIFVEDSKDKEIGMDKIMEILRKQHSDLARIVECLNRSFGVLLILTIVSGYIIVSNQFYSVYKLSEGFSEINELPFTVYTILWVILHISKVVLILYPMNNVTNEVKRF